MTDPRRVIEGAGATALLALLDGTPRTGSDLQAAIGLDDAAFRRIAIASWSASLLQGVVIEGCCQDPCAEHCVSAMRMTQAWCLSRKGASTLRHRRP
jgi:hypothetical protein